MCTFPLNCVKSVVKIQILWLVSEIARRFVMVWTVRQRRGGAAAQRATRDVSHQDRYIPESLGRPYCRRQHPGLGDPWTMSKMGSVGSFSQNRSGSRRHDGSVSQNHHSAAYWLSHGEAAEPTPRRYTFERSHRTAERWYYIWTISAAVRGMAQFVHVLGGTW